MIDVSAKQADFPAGREPSARERLEAAIDRFGQELERLEARVGPVLKDNENMDPAPTPIESSPLAATVLVFELRLRHLEDLINRLDL